MTTPSPFSNSGDDDEAAREFFEFFNENIAKNLRNPDGSPMDPEMLKAMNLPQDPASLMAMFEQVQQMMSASGDDPVNWELAQQTARQVTAASGDSTVGQADVRGGTEALRLAEIWLDGVTDVPAASITERVWSRAEWVEASLPTWQRLTEPIARSVSEAIMGALKSQVPPEMQEMTEVASGMMRGLGGTVFGAQVGQAVGTLSGQVLSASDVGLPIGAQGTRALVTANIATFAEGLDVPAEEVRLYIALREAAHARLFAHAGWLGPRLIATVQEYAAGINIDTSKMESAIATLDPSDPSALQQAMSEGMFEPQRSPAQQAALTRLETLLALVEGWVDVVVNKAAVQLPNAGRLSEAIRRRRASGGPAEHTFASLVGLELRPRRLRDAANLWAALEAKHGAGARDEVWSHPDLMPSTADLDDPIGFAEHWGATDADSDMDAALQELLSGGAGPASGQQGGDSGNAPSGDPGTEHPRDQ